MCNICVYSTYVLHMYLVHMLYICISTHGIHTKHHTCITGVAQLAMYRLRIKLVPVKHLWTLYMGKLFYTIYVEE